MKAVLFDLDGTLLEIDSDAFGRRYMAELERAMRPLFYDSRMNTSFAESFSVAAKAMMSSHPGRTNEQVFFDEFMRRTGVDLRAHAYMLDRFYDEVFPILSRYTTPAEGGTLAVSTAKELGLRVAIATNPVFPRTAVEHRLRWAGIGKSSIDAVTSYEHMEACKPSPLYFRQTAELLGVEPAECLMVGDDRVLDMPASDVGMRTFYVGRSQDAVSDYRGDLRALSGLLPKLV